MHIRKPTIEEKKIIDFLIKKSGMDYLLEQLETILVSFMDDGGMGSLLIYPQGIFPSKRLFGKQASEYQYKDVDQIDVLISLNIDDRGYLYELDIWKTDFSKVIGLPNIESL